MLYTINDISEGAWITTVYDRKTVLQVLMVDYERDLFTALDWKRRERWERLKSDDVLKIKKLPINTNYLFAS